MDHDEGDPRRHGEVRKCDLCPHVKKLIGQCAAVEYKRAYQFTGHKYAILADIIVYYVYKIN